MDRLPAGRSGTRRHVLPVIVHGLASLRRTLRRTVYAALPRSWQEVVERQYYYVLLRFGLADLSEETEYELLPRLVLPGQTVVDVGANVGAYTLRLSELVGHAGRVHAFEPSPRTFGILEHNVRKLAPHPNVTLHPVALSDIRGSAVLHVPLEGSLGTCYYASLAKDPDMRTRAVAVETVTLDERLGAETGPIAFVKIDTEGAELNVLRGGARILREHRPAILCEIAQWIRRFGHAPIDVFRTLEPLGYQAFLYRSGDLQRVHVPQDDVRRNYLFLQADVRERLGID